MEKPDMFYWSLRLEEVKSALEKNNFEAFIAKDTETAKSIVENEIIPQLKPKSISWGGSKTFIKTGIYDSLKNRRDYEIIDTYDRQKYTPEEVAERRRQALLTDLFITFGAFFGQPLKGRDYNFQ